VSRKSGFNKGLPERCARFYQSRFLDQPMCGCGSCWMAYFSHNPAKTYTGYKALSEYGEEAVKIAQGKERALQVEQQETLEIAAGLRRGRSNYVQIGYDRGTKYLKHLKQFLKEYPITEAHQEVAA
jgi:hypothetical protein